MVKIAALAGSTTPVEGESDARAIAIPFVIIAAFVVFQITPLPPRVVRALSSGTFEVYSHALDGWPGSRPYDNFGAIRPAAIAIPDTAAGPVILPSVDEVKKGAPIPFAPRSAKPPAKAAAHSQTTSPVSILATRIYGGSWIPITSLDTFRWSFRSRWHVRSFRICLHRVARRWPSGSSARSRVS